MAGATIKLFLPTGDAQSLRVAEISNWNGLAIAAPRTELETFLKREELDKPAVYLLIGTDAVTGKPAAYIGEAEEGGKRLRQHRDKEFWVQLVVFVSKDENLTKAHIRYLEGRLIEEAGKIGRFKLVNDQSSGAKLPEADREDMEVFLSRIRQLLPILGCDILIPVLRAEAVKGSTERLTMTVKGIVASGQRTPAGFVIFKDSQAASLLRPSAPPDLIKKRNELTTEGVLAADGDHLKFSKDIEFTSPSAAAAVVCGGSANGLISWKTLDGRTLKELEAAV